MIVGLLPPMHSRLRIPSSRLRLLPVQCPVPSLDGHCLYAYIKPCPSLARPFLHCCVYCQAINASTSRAQACSLTIAVVGMGLLAGVWRAGDVSMKNASFLAPCQRPLPQRFCTLNHPRGALELPWKFGDSCPTRYRVMSGHTYTHSTL